MAYKKPSQWCSHDGVDGAVCDACVLTRGHLGCCGYPNKSRSKEGTAWCDYLCKKCADRKDEKDEAAITANMRPEQRQLREEKFTSQCTQDAPATSKATREAPPPDPPDKMAALTHSQAVTDSYLVLLQDQIEELQKTVSTMAWEIKNQSQAISQLQEDQEKQAVAMSDLRGYLTYWKILDQDFHNGPPIDWQ